MPGDKTFYQKEITFSYELEDVKVINVVRTRLLERGEGREKNPVRRIEQFWSMDGELLWEKDPYQKPTGVKRNKK